MVHKGLHDCPWAVPHNHNGACRGYSRGRLHTMLDMRTCFCQLSSVLGISYSSCSSLQVLLVPSTFASSLPDRSCIAPLSASICVAVGAESSRGFVASSSILSGCFAKASSTGPLMPSLANKCRKCFRSVRTSHTSTWEFDHLDHNRCFKPPPALHWLRRSDVVSIVSAHRNAPCGGPQKSVHVPVKLV